MAEVLEDVESLTKLFTKRDFVLIYAGMTDCRGNTSIDEVQLQISLLNLLHTNTIVIGIPLFVDRLSLNTHIHKNNKKMRKVVDPFMGAYYIDVNKILYDEKDEKQVLIPPVKEHILGTAMKEIINNVYTLYFANIINNYV